MKLSAGICVYPPMLDTVCPATSPAEDIKEIHALLEGPEPDRTMLAYALYGQGCREELEERRGQRQRGQPPAVVPHVKVQMPPWLNSITFYIRLTPDGIG